MAKGMTNKLFVVFFAISAILLDSSKRTSLVNGQSAECPRTWNYADSLQWGEMCDYWSQCSSLFQSPIDVVTPIKIGKQKPLHTQYKNLPIALFNTGNALKMPVNKTDGNIINLNGESFYLREIRWVAPSEHKINGEAFELEMQLVHDSLITEKKRAIVAIMFNIAQSEDSNVPLETVFMHLPDYSDCWCGNKRIDPGEECDNGEDNDNNKADACRTNCKLPSCGDGVVDNCEECDDGELNSDVSAGRCRATLPFSKFGKGPRGCVRPACGDGVIDGPQEQCDDGNNQNRDGCDSTCQYECGDGFQNNETVARTPGQAGYEECDQGSLNSNEIPNRCRQFLVGGIRVCKRPFCGDGVRDDGEACDFGSRNSNSTPDGCRLPDSRGFGGCKLSFCGDGVIDSNEDCDAGEDNGPNYVCSATCRSQCGDGVVQRGEQCDLGHPSRPGGQNSNAPDSQCRLDCSAPKCGDGIVDVRGCPDSEGTLSCRIEQCDGGWLQGQAPPGAPFATWVGDIYCGPNCQVLCGNGIIDKNVPGIPDEECDISMNYNSEDASICRPNCVLAKCGDGIVDPELGELCDEGAGNANSSNAACRVNCVPSICGDGIVDQIFGEDCDDGNLFAEDGCDPACKFECGNGKLGILPQHTVSGVTIPSQPEKCDAGSANANVPNQCRARTQQSGKFNIVMCSLPMCGDGIKDDGEECDEGKQNSNTRGNACRTDCTLPYCGDGVVDSMYGEKCDNGRKWNSDVDTSDNGCSTTCIQNTCRRALVTQQFPGKVLNLNSFIPQQDISALCYTGSFTEPPCDSNVTWVIFEEIQTLSPYQLLQFKDPRGAMLSGSRGLQPKNGRTARFCNPNEQVVMPVCGNGVLEQSEECDNGFRNSDVEANACRTNCRRWFCGDGIVDSIAEECDDPTDKRCDMMTCRWKTLLVNPNQYFWSYKRAGDWAKTVDPHCAGDMQSPINLQRDWNKDFGEVDASFLDGHFTYSQNVPIQFFNTRNNAILKVTTGANNRFTWDGVNYYLEEISIHSPSEHHINGKIADFEIQYIHRASSGKVVAFSTLYDESEARNTYLEQFWFYIPRFTENQCGNGRVEGTEQCDDGHRNSDYKADACRTNCMLPHCGDGIVDANENCDKGFWNNDGVDGVCRTDCRFARCGDGQTDTSLGEECDQGPTGGDKCNEKCFKLCGNHIVDPGEQCDDGIYNSDITPSESGAKVCRKNCKWASCGDGIVDEFEQCDLGSHINANRSNTCRIPGIGGWGGCKLPVCGDGIVDPVYGEQCDDGINNGERTSHCTHQCTLKCGDGFLDQESGENCDNGFSGNGNLPGQCRFDCRLPVCGDEIVDDMAPWNEQCDSGRDNGNVCLSAPLGCPRCSANCAIRCGNGQEDLGEECDLGADNSDSRPDCCRSNCLLPWCGDGVLDSNEECDAGPANSDAAGSPCRSNCVLPTCGDLILDMGEECDDGNQNADDGCSPTCKKECGNGMKNGYEQCDDGPFNANSADACRTNCMLPKCGDSIVDTYEQCDIGTPMGILPPNKCRGDCTIPVCGDGVVDNLYGEECDAGASNSDTNWDGCSTDCKWNIPRQCSVPTEHQTLDLRWAYPKLKTSSPGPSSGVYIYNGSATRPPCSHGWTWFVFDEVQPINSAHVEAWRHAFSAPNSRGLQAAHGRRIDYPTVGAICGNCKREGTEECDDGERNSNTQSGACRKDCKKPRCGDGIVDDTLGEQCDSHPGCDEFCRWVASCPAGASCTSCPAGGCSNLQTVGPNSTVVNVNFAGILSKSTCTTCSK